MAITIKIDDKATPFFEMIKTRMANATDLNLHVAKAAQVEVKRSLIARNAQGNKQEWPRTGFFGHAAEATRAEANSQEGRVVIAWQGIRTHFDQPFEIHPVNVKMLTIPATAEAYGHRAREFSGLVVRLIKTERGLRPVLMAEGEVEQAGASKKRAGALKKAAGKIFYWLVPRVMTHPDPAMLSLVERLPGIVKDAAKAFIEKLKL